MNQNVIKLGCAGLLAMLGANAWAQTTPYTIISTTNDFDGHYFGLQNGEQFGNIINLDKKDYDITVAGGGFQFNYAVPGGVLNANVGVDITFYYTTAAGAPTTPFYSSGWFYNGVNETSANPNAGGIPAYTSTDYLDYSTTDFTVGDGPGAIPLSTGVGNGYWMPQQFLFTIDFTNISANQIIIPIAGTTNSYATTVQPDYWVNINGVWTEYTNSVGNNAIFTFTGVPEPTTMGLAGLGGLLLLGARQWKRSKVNRG